MIEVGDIVRFVTWEEHEYGKMLRPLLEKERGRLFVVLGEDIITRNSQLIAEQGRSLILERLNDPEPFRPGQTNHTIWEGWLKKDEFLSAVARAQRLGPDVSRETSKQETEV